MTIYIRLNIIGHSTNYLKPFFFVVTVNLTMLVLNTMSVGVSQSRDLPKTIYIKMVDIIRAVLAAR